MKFAHLSDIHIGSWKDPRLRNVSTTCFIHAMQVCMEEQVDFILISGDLFDTSLPAVDLLTDVTTVLKKVHDFGIRVYIIAGSHDFSPSGRTMLSVLEEAGLVINVAKGEDVDGRLQLIFTIDQTGAKITGIIGKKGMLDHHFYSNLDREALENEDGYKIFLFHTAISELKPKELEQMEAHPLSLLPTGFNYYAGGHVHTIQELSLPGYVRVVYPGALFPCNFAELQKYSHGYVHISENDVMKAIPIIVHNCVHSILDVGQSTVDAIQLQLVSELKDIDVQGKIVTIRIIGTVENGRVSDVDFRTIFKDLYNRGAHMVMKNTEKLLDIHFKEGQIEMLDGSVVEQTLLKQHIENDRQSFASSLIQTLSSEKQEGEKVVEFERRILTDAVKLLGANK